MRVEQFNNLANDIQTLTQQQQAIVVTLQAPEMLEEKVVSKEHWIEIMKPLKHLEFLESLGLTSDEISQIRHL